jgi:hypothetical protein
MSISRAAQPVPVTSSRPADGGVLLRGRHHGLVGTGVGPGELFRQRVFPGFRLFPVPLQRHLTGGLAG